MKKYTPEQLDQIFLQIKEFVTCPEYKLRIIDLRKFIDEIYPREADTSKEDFAEIKKIALEIQNDKTLKLNSEL